MPKTSEDWELPGRRREMEQGDAPRECYFCLDEQFQDYFRMNWLRGASPDEIKRDWERRAGVSKTAGKPSWETAGEAQAEPDHEPDQPQSDRWKSPAFRGSEPRY